MCRYIYLTEVGKEAKHERLCADESHPEHRERYTNGNWETIVC